MSARLANLVLCCAVLGVPVAAEDAKPAAVRLYVHASGPANDFTPIDLRDRQDSARDVTKHLKRLSGFGTRLRKVIRVAEKAEDADIVVDIVGREARDDWRTVKAVIAVKGRTFDITGTNDDNDWSDAGSDLADRLVEWVRDNRARIAESR